MIKWFIKFIILFAIIMKKQIQQVGENMLNKINYNCNVWYLFIFNEDNILLSNKKIKVENILSINIF